MRLSFREHAVVVRSGPILDDNRMLGTA